MDHFLSINYTSYSVSTENLQNWKIFQTYIHEHAIKFGMLFFFIAHFCIFFLFFFFMFFTILLLFLHM